MLWSWADERSDLGLALRCALIAASLRSRSGNLTPELLVQLVTVGTPEGTWSPAAALEHVAQMPDERKQRDCLAALVAADIRLPMARAIEIARAIDDEWHRAAALATLAPHLSPDLLGEALEIARAIDAEDARAHALEALAPHLPPDLLVEALAEARTIYDERSRAHALAALAPRLLPNLLAEALAAARAIIDELRRAFTLAALAPQLAQHPALAQHFLPTLRGLARRPRDELLSNLTALAAWIGAIAAWRGQPAPPVALAQAVVDVGRCWR